LVAPLTPVVVAPRPPVDDPLAAADPAFAETTDEATDEPLNHVPVPLKPKPDPVCDDAPPTPKLIRIDAPGV
jgi:hypothetical protein